MYKYPTNLSITTTAEEDSTPLLNSTQNSNNYSSLYRRSNDNTENVNCLYEVDNESIQRQQSIISNSSRQRNIRDNSSSHQVVNRSLFSHSFWQSIFDHYSTSVYLENKGSVARDHLANERTYLAWLRTSLSTISVGIGITQLFRLERKMTHHPPTKQHTHFLDGQMIGIFFILISMVFLLFAFMRYFHTQVALTKGFFPASRTTVTLASCLLLSTMAMMLASVLNQ